MDNIEVHNQMLYQASLDDAAGRENTTAQCYRDNEELSEADYWDDDESDNFLQQANKPQ